MVGALASCGSSSHSSSSATTTPSSPATTGATGAAASTATGKPIVLLTIASKEAFPGVGVGMKAAAKAINDAGGIKDPSGGPNRPISIVVCDDISGENADANCGREAVADHALAVVGSQTAFGNVYDPIIFQAGIPEVAEGAYFASQVTSPLSFPIINSIASTTDGFEFLAAAVGAKSNWAVLANVPTAIQQTGLIAQADKAAGVKLLGKSLVSASATSSPDYAPYAAAAVGAGAQEVFMDIGPGGVGVMKSLLDQGVSFDKTAVAADCNVISLADLAPLGNNDNGVYFVCSAYPSTDAAIAGVKQFDDEMNAYGDTTTPRTEAAEMAWTGVHVIANELAKVPTISSAALVTAMNNTGPTQYGPMAPWNWSKKVYTTGPFVGQRYFSDEMLVTRIVNGQNVPITNGFVPIGQPFQVTPAGELSK